MVNVTTVSSFQMTLNNRLKLASLNGQLLQANDEVASGLKSDVYSSLGSGAAQTLILRQQMDVADSFLVTNELVAGRMSAMDEALGAARDAAQSFLSLALPNASGATQTASQLQSSALSAISSIVSALNTTYGGSALFAGTRTDGSALQEWSKASATTGTSPEDAVAALVGGTITDSNDAAAKIAALEAAFASTSGTTSDFEGTFYNGTPAQTGGTDNARLTARIAQGVTLDYGIQANDSAILDTLRGLAMFATMDVTTITDSDAYAAWVGDAINTLSSGISGVDQSRATLGNQQNLVETQTARHQQLSDLYNNRILDLEGVDPYEAATRVSALQTQIEATYAVTAQLQQLSILNYL
ncbi:flagellin [Frigidibacter sp. MR17.14]|uniref:flagellin n=1 Tax=Frigidibacter sp. MR17.14 TaxID=3126509 RepID=UPI003012CF7E